MSVTPEETKEEQLYCYRHPETPTRLRCSRCDIPICGECATPATVGQHCPECIRDAQRSAPKVRTALRASAPAVFFLIALNVGVFVLQQIFFELTGRLGLIPVAIAIGGEYWRLVTPMVLHAGVLHLLLNQFILFSYGPLVEQTFKTTRFVAMYLIAGLMGSAASYTFNECNILGLGASGAIFGIVGGLLVFMYNRRHSTVVGQYLRGILIFIGINLVFGFMIAGVDNYAHLGGLAGGVVLGMGYDQGGRSDPSRLVQLLTTVIVLGAAMALIAYRTSTFSCI